MARDEHPDRTTTPAAAAAGGEAAPSSRAAPMTENERWQATLAALLEIAHDPLESGSRRRKADAAWWGAVSGSGSSSSIVVGAPPVPYNRRGGHFLRTLREETG